MLGMVSANKGDALRALASTRAASVGQWLEFGPYTSGMHRETRAVLSSDMGQGIMLLSRATERYMDLWFWSVYAVHNLGEGTS